jgi:hypothetical protein
MSPLLLATALLLPWLAGALALRPLQPRLGLTPAAWLGYGYFLGAALITASAFLAAWLPWLATSVGLVLCLAAFTLAATLGATWLAQRLATAAPLALPPATWPQRVLIALLLALIALHLGLSAAELYWRPVYPWDAWQTWAYTAKAWYFNGAPVNMLPPAQWANLPEGALYTAQGHRYPWLVPAQSWWFARVLGAWQESRVVWPALPAAIALGLALWGQAVAATRQRLAGPLAAALLLSLPLLHTHISLAGYADVWLAGFSGLGLIALARGLLEGHRGQLLLGLAALALGLLVKHDAVIWLTCGLVFICLLRLRHLRATTLMLAGAVLAGALAFAFSRLDLQLHSDFNRYAQLLWRADSWHLLWYLLPAAVLLGLLPKSPARATAKTLGLLLGIVLASQLVLFGATSAGGWVSTAASRLLLQVSPLLVFALACLVGASGVTAAARHWRRSALAVAAGTLGFLLVLGTWLFASTSASDKSAPPLNFAASQLHVIEGPLRPLYGQLVLSPAVQQHAIVSSGPVRFNAQDYPLLKVNADGGDQYPHTLLWRTAAQPTQPFTRDISLESGQLILSEDEHWQGEILEVGLVLYAKPQQPLVLQGWQLQPATPPALLRFATTDWLTPSFWSQTSINRTELSRIASLPSLPMLAGLWVLLTWLALRLLTGAAPPLRPLLAAALLAWLLLDARWLHNSIQQAQATQAHYSATRSPNALDTISDAATLKLARQARAYLGQEPRQLVIIAQDPDDKFALSRLKYALLPHAAHLHTGGSLSPRRAATAGAVIWLSDDLTRTQSQCPKPLQRSQPVVATARGILCTPPKKGRGAHE